MRNRSVVVRLGRNGPSTPGRLAAAGSAVATHANRVVFRVVIGIGSVLAWGTPAFA